jgi:hypothetical protein
MFQRRAKLIIFTKAKPRSLSNNETKSSFKVSNLIIKKCKPFTEGEFVSECFLEVADNLSF